MITLRKSKNLNRITAEWNRIALVRDEQITSGRDHSANFILAPAILSEIPKAQALIDIGCGTGWLTERATKYAKITVGVDPSEKSIAIGRERHNGAGIIYHALSIEQYATEAPKFDAAISNMSASSAPDLKAFLSGSRNVLRENSLFIFTIPHPCFWPIYWGYASHPDFDYQKSFAIEEKFKIQNESSNILTTHFHHPLETYLATLIKSRFKIEEIKELKGRGFSLPRFLLLKARAI